MSQCSAGEELQKQVILEVLSSTSRFRAIRVLSVSGPTFTTCAIGLLAIKTHTMRGGSCFSKCLGEAKPRPGADQLGVGCAEGYRLMLRLLTLL